jgi:hypothetical protein
MPTNMSPYAHPTNTTDACAADEGASYANATHTSATDSRIEDDC